MDAVPHPSPGQSMVSSAPPQDPVDKVRLVLDYVPAEVLRQIADDDEELELLASLDRRVQRDVTAKSITHATVVVERPEPKPVSQVEPPGGVAVPSEDGDAAEEDEIEVFEDLKELEAEDDEELEEPEDVGEILVYESGSPAGELPREVLLLDAGDVDSAPVTVVPDEHVYRDAADDLEAEDLAAVGEEPVDVLTFTCDVCSTVYDVEDTGERPLEHDCPGCGTMGVLGEDEAPDLLVETAPVEELEAETAEMVEEEDDAFAGFVYVGEVPHQDGWEPSGATLEDEPEAAEEDGDILLETDLDEEAADEAEAEEEVEDDEFTFTPPTAEDEVEDDLVASEEDEEDLDDLWLDWDEDEEDDAFDSVDWPEDEEDDAFELVDPGELATNEEDSEVTQDEAEEAYAPWDEPEDTGEELEAEPLLSEPDEEDGEEEILTFELDEEEEDEEDVMEFESLGEVTDEDDDLPMALPWDERDDAEEEDDEPGDDVPVEEAEVAEEPDEDAATEDVDEAEDTGEPDEDVPPEEAQEVEEDPTSFEVPPEEAEIAEEEDDVEPDPGVTETSQEDGIPVESLPGVGSIYADHLDEAGIHTTRDLLGQDPWSLSQDTDISSELMAEWIHISELLHHVGISQVYAEILAKVDVEGADDLLGRDPEELAQAVNRYIAASDGSDVPPPITAEQVARWQSTGQQDAS